MIVPQEAPLEGQGLVTGLAQLEGKAPATPPCGSPRKWIPAALSEQAAYTPSSRRGSIQAQYFGLGEGGTVQGRKHFWIVRCGEDAHAFSRRPTLGLATAPPPPAEGAAWEENGRRAHPGAGGVEAPRAAQATQGRRRFSPHGAPRAAGWVGALFPEGPARNSSWAGQRCPPPLLHLQPGPRRPARPTAGPTRSARPGEGPAPGPGTGSGALLGPWAARRLRGEAPTRLRPSATGPLAIRLPPRGPAGAAAGSAGPSSRASGAAACLGPRRAGPRAPGALGGPG